MICLVLFLSICLTCAQSEGRNCDRIRKLQNGIATTTTVFSCNSGYVLNGREQVTCDEGKWSDSVPTCVDINECASDKGGCGGTCTNTLGSYQCSCPHGGALQTDMSCLGCPEKPFDVIFVVDASGSVGRTNFQKVLNFINKLIDNFIIDNDNVNVGFVRFESKARDIFHLDAHKDKTSLKAAVKSVKYTGGGTLMSSALRMMRTDHFNKKNGNRPGIPDIAIVLTDGAFYKPKQAIAEADSAKADGIQIFTVGIGSKVRVDQVNSISTGSYFSDNFDTLLDQVLNTLFHEICKDQ